MIHALNGLLHQSHWRNQTRYDERGTRHQLERQGPLHSREGRRARRRKAPTAMHNTSLCASLCFFRFKAQHKPCYRLPIISSLASISCCSSAQSPLSDDPSASSVITSSLSPVLTPGVIHLGSVPFQPVSIKATFPPLSANVCVRLGGKPD